jgi:hypothetical protein
MYRGKQYSMIFFYGSTALVGLGRFFQFPNLYTVCRTPCTGDQPIPRQLPTHRTTQTQNKRTHRHPCLERETNPVFKRAKTVHALNRAATVIGSTVCYSCIFLVWQPKSHCMLQQLFERTLLLKCRNINCHKKEVNICQGIPDWFLFQRLF